MKEFLCTGPTPMTPDGAAKLVSYIIDNFDRNKDGKLDFFGNNNNQN